MAKPLTSSWTQDSFHFPTDPTISTGILYYEEKTSVVFERLKYIRSASDGAEELYDLTADPAEKTSVSALTPERLREAEEILNRYDNDSAEARKALGIPDELPIGIDPELREELRALGYIE